MLREVSVSTQTLYVGWVARFLLRVRLKIYTLVLVHVLESSIPSNVIRAIKINEYVQDEACSKHRGEQKCI